MILAISMCTFIHIYRIFHLDLRLMISEWKANCLLRH